MAISHCYWHLVLKHGNFTCLQTNSGHGNFNYWPSGHVTPQIDHLRKMEPSPDGYNTHRHVAFLRRYMGFNKMFIFLSKPSHVTPQIDHLGKTSPVLRVSTHVYGVSKEINGKTLIFQLNLGMWPLKLISLMKNKPCSDSFNTHLWCFQGDRWENVH